MKLATIMTITNADRASDLHALDRRFLQETPEGMLFRVLGLIKTRRSGGPKEVLHPKFSEYSVTIFEGVAEALYPVGRKTTVPVKRLHKAVTAATISRWLKEILCRATVHTNIFKAHSTRTASTSAAKVQGVSTVDIMKVTNWTRESIFTRFY